MGVYPYKFIPLLKEKIWGGRAFERLFGRRLPPRTMIGESWELADLPPERLADHEEGESLVAEGPDANKTLHELLRRDDGQVLGRARPLEYGRFPLLLKLLDANDVLSLQVHPDEEAAGKLGPPAVAKTECWYVLESRGGYLYKGLQPGVTLEQLTAALAVAEQKPEELRALLGYQQLKAGDFHYLPGGTLHALGKGSVVAEIQTPSTTTYRVSDWGRGRCVHVAEALQCVRLHPPSAPPPGAEGDVLLRCRHFTVRRLTAGPGRQELAGGSCAAWMVVRGQGRLLAREDPAGRPGPGGTTLRAGDTVLLPADLTDLTLRVEEELTWLEVTLPEA